MHHREDIVLEVVSKLTSKRPKFKEDLGSTTFHLTLYQFNAF